NGRASPTSIGAARRARAIGVSGEFGGGGTATVDTMAITARAIDSLMITLGVVEAPVLAPESKPSTPTRLLSLSRLHTMCEAGDCLLQVAEPVEG
ncbi:MAG: hypothetical protein E5V24_19820, partial [Mesorhizobium sp.]